MPSKFQFFLRAGDYLLALFLFGVGIVYDFNVFLLALSGIALVLAILNPAPRLLAYLRRRRPMSR